jgi:hypothetical protein
MAANRRLPLPACLAAACLAVAFALAPAAPAVAQFGGGFRQVGGISIDAGGIVGNVEPGALESLARDRRALLDGVALPAGDGGLRKVSLAAVVAAVREAGASGKDLPPDVLLLGGLERITHVFVDPDRHDIVLAGPGGKPAVDARGDVVAAGSGRPLLHLEDLVVALRSVAGARAGGVQCSIDPTPEGLARLRTYLGGQRTMGPDAAAVFRGMEDALGPQVVRVGGVPAGSRFARVLVAADYRMKRIGMGLEPSGVAGLPSYLSMVPAGGKAASLPRFWLEAGYDPIARDADELAWRISGRRMECLTESDALAQGGVERGKGAEDPIARKWCAAMTAHYDELADHQPIFAELLNCVDLAVVAALVEGRQLADRAGLDLQPLLAAPLPEYDVPRTVPTVATGMKRGSSWVLTASGGVQFQPWEFVDRTVAAADETGVRTTALAAKPAGSWWWQ